MYKDLLNYAFRCDSKNIRNVTKYCISNNCGTVEWAIHQTIIIVSTEILNNTTVLNIDDAKKCF